MKRKSKIEADLDPPGMHSRPGAKAADSAIANAKGARKPRARAVKPASGMEADLDPVGHTRPGSRAADVALANAGNAGKRGTAASNGPRKKGR